jgi:hypothetical protein
MDRIQLSEDGVQLRDPVKTVEKLAVYKSG